MDGVLEINRTCAENTGCFSGDTPGLPVTIGQEGSYRLTSNLIQRNAGNVIDIMAERVSVDLNGFTIRCDAPDDCPSDHAISANFNSHDTVMNGTVMRFADHRVELWAFAQVHRVRSMNNGDAGIWTQTISNVTGCIASYNNQEGIYVDFGSTVHGNTVSNNTGNGITAGQGTTITNNTSMVNSGHGIATSAGSTITFNTARGNTSGFGLSMSSNVGYGHNSITNNNGGDANPQVSSGVQIGTNLSGLNTICP